MKYCPSCGMLLEQDTVFCPACGTKQPQISNTSNVDNNVAKTTKETNTSLVPIIIMWALSILLIIACLCMPGEDTNKTDKAAEIRAQLFAGFSVCALISSVFSFIKAKKLYAQDKAPYVQVVYAISIFILAASAFSAFVASLALPDLGVHVMFPVLALVGAGAFVWYRRKKNKG